MNKLYIYIKERNTIGIFKIIKETPKQYKIEYDAGVNVLEPIKKVWSMKEWFYKSEVDNNTYPNIGYIAATSIKSLNLLICSNLKKQKSELEKIIKILEEEK